MKPANKNINLWSPPTKDKLSYHQFKTKRLIVAKKLSGKDGC